MDFAVEIGFSFANVAFAANFLACIFVEIREQNRARRTRFFDKIVIVSNSLISIFYSFLSYQEIVFSKTFPILFSSSALAWILATLITLKNHKKRPLVLITWWVLSLISNSLLISTYLIDNFTSIKVPNYLPRANYVDFASFPLLILLCFISLLVKDCEVLGSDDIEQPLLRGKLKSENKFEDPYSCSGIWSIITFRWLNPLFEIGKNLKLEFSHIPCIPRSETASIAYDLLEKSLRKQKDGKFSLPKAVADAIWKPLVVNGVFAGLNTIAAYIGPVLITSFVNLLSSDQENSSHYYGLVLAFIFFFSKTLESISQRLWYFGAQRLGIRIRSALMVLIYKKTLSIKYGGISSGKVISVISADVEKIGDFFLHIHNVWLLPLQVTLALVILHINLGAFPAFMALFSTIIVMLSNHPLAKRQERLIGKIMEAKDSRIKFTSEILKSMRVLKLHSWESSFLEKLLKLRKAEREWLKKHLYTCSVVCFLFWASPTLVSVFTFGVCILCNTPLTPGTVLTAIATFRILQEAINNFPELISMITQSKVAVDRIHEFLKDDQNKLVLPFHPSYDDDVAVEIDVGEYSWDLKRPTIKIAEKLKILKGSKVAICGSVGSGKSSLLCSILGEIPKLSGAIIKVNGSKAFVPQRAWIQTGPVRDNVLFGKEMIESFYEEVLEGCALNKDIEMWANGDSTIVGERGINLSGGQKQRVQLARAIYNDSDIYFLDDPFSAVDAHTGAHLFKCCLKQLLAQKTVIYVTHQLEFLEAADLVLVMKDGRVSQSGKYEDLIQNPNGELARQMSAHGKSLNQVSSTHDQESSSQNTLDQNNQIEVAVEKGEENEIFREKSQEEETETGRVKWNVYSTFITCAYRGGLVFPTVLCHIIFYGLQIASTYWVAWATDEKRAITSKQMIGIYSLMSGGSSFFILGRAILLSTIAIETGRRLFLGMITSVFRAPLSFFDTTPSSRILNRSSTDQSTVDTDIPYRVAGLVFAIIQLFSIIILMSMIAWPVLFLFVAIVAISVWYQCYYITTARELARMVGTKKAPILHHVSESVAGASTIRCFNQENSFLNKNSDLVDQYSRVAFHNYATMEWLCVRINFLFNFGFFLVLIILVNLPRSAIDPSMAGLVATYGLNLNIIQSWVIWNFCNVENKMISVERILQFTKIPSEAPLVIEDSKPEPEWPTNGNIELEDLVVRYDPSLPIVLKRITCTFPGNRKIGVVGRTGSGKSTLIQALFRAIEPSSGRILIDGVDISKIGLMDLRSRLSIIPQDPTLFQGTIRSNIDPLEQYSDLDIWQALEKCDLADIVKQDQRGLDMPVAEDGENWSVGQRQLVCLARVLLQKRRILVLDEATASMDTATDAVIQSRIREETCRCTVITIAHRINTIIDNDLVLVLDEGKVVEFDSPNVLLKDNSSAFSKLVNEFLSRSSTDNHT